MAIEPNGSPLGASPFWRFTLKNLFIWTAIIALGCVALRSASGTWVAAMLGLALFALAASILLVIFRRGPERAYWIGFATFGWLYMLLVLFSWNIDPNSFSENPFRPYNLLTTRLSNASYHLLYDAAFEKHFASYPTGPGGGYGGPVPSGMMPGMSGSPDGYGMSMMGSGSMPGGPPGMGGLGGMGPAPPYPGPSQDDFANVAHALWTILLAALGGLLARWLYATGPVGQVSNLPRTS